MNQRVSFNEKMAVERLVPLPQYSCYTELINTGVQCINTSIFTDMDILNLHFYQLLDLFKDGIETDQIQKQLNCQYLTIGLTYYSGGYLYQVITQSILDIFGIMKISLRIVLLIISTVRS